MGGVGTLLMPVTPSYMASWASHQKRSPKSSEPGTDMFVPIGTPVYAPEEGIIYGTGNSIAPATGRWVGINFKSGMSFRALHLSRLVRTAGVVYRGDLIGYSGATGYGYEDWSHLPTMPAAHVHVTLWPTVVRRFGYDSQGKPYTIDFMNFVGGPAGGGGSTPPETSIDKDTEMDYLFQVDPKVDGRWVVANYREGTMRVIPNGFQLDQIRSEKSMPTAKPLYEFNGPQTPDKIAGLRVI